MNRQNRRHPTHPLLPNLYPSNHRIPDTDSSKTKTSIPKNKKYKRYRV